MLSTSPPRQTVRTVLGDIAPEQLGTTNYHEHLFQISPLLPGDELDDEALSEREATLLASSGFQAMVDATPIGLGRRPEALARISANTGLTVIATTGRHREAHYPDSHPIHRLTAQELGARFTRELLHGLPVSDDGEEIARTASNEPVKAGVLKAAVGYWSVSQFEHDSLAGVGIAHRHSGAPVMVHLEHCSAAHEVLDLLEQMGVSSTAVCLAHADRLLDAGLHVSLIERGAVLGYDGMARTKTHSDEQLIELTARVISQGGVSNILLGGDVARKTRYLAYGGMPGLEYLGKRYLPRLRDKVGPDALRQILVDNAARWLAWQPKAGNGD